MMLLHLYYGPLINNLSSPIYHCREKAYGKIFHSPLYPLYLPLVNSSDAEVIDKINRLDRHYRCNYERALFQDNLTLYIDYFGVCNWFVSDDEFLSVLVEDAEYISYYKKKYNIRTPHHWLQSPIRDIDLRAFNLFKHRYYFKSFMEHIHVLSIPF